MGIVALKSTGTEGDINRVERAFESLDLKFNQRLDSILSTDGVFMNSLNDALKAGSDANAELLDPNNPNAPLYVLKSELKQAIEQIRDRLARDAGASEERAKGTQKGFDFEDRCEEKLGELAQASSDIVERTGSLGGLQARDKKGDFVVTLSENKKRVVFEVKHRGSISINKIREEVEEAMRNRNADYGVFIAKNRASLSRDIGWFNEYDGRWLVCAAGDDNEDLMDGEIIHIAYKWARARLRLESVQKTRPEPNAIMKKVGEIRTRLGDLKKIRAQCTSISDTANGIKETAKEAERKIREDLDEVIDSLTRDKP